MNNASKHQRGKHRILATLVLLVCTQVWAQSSVIASPPGRGEPVAGNGYILDGVQAFLEAELGKQSGIYTRTSIELGVLDSRLNLPTCPTALYFRLHGKELQPGNVMVKVNCAGSNPWSIYVPATIKAYRDVVVASSGYNAGFQLGPMDIMLEERELSTLRSNYLLDPTQISGQMLKRRVKAGDVITSQMLTPAKVIKKGQDVAIRASSGPVTVRMAGEALSDGRVGDLINVRNRQSKRVVRAEVISNGEVQVPL